LGRTISRRRMLRLTGGTLLGILLASCGSDGSGGRETTEEHASADTHGIVFNTGSKDVTLFNPATNEVTGTRQTSAAVRWLSNEQHYWDGESIWTYDFPNNELQAIAIDPQTFEVTKQVPVGGSGPGHSFVLSPDNRRGFVNCAGSDFLAVVDPVAGEVTERVEVGAFP
jgi:DNA-binding beta-propeller fold protein YncE